MKSACLKEGVAENRYKGAYLCSCILCLSSMLQKSFDTAHLFPTKDSLQGEVAVLHLQAATGQNQSDVQCKHA